MSPFLSAPPMSRVSRRDFYLLQQLADRFGSFKIWILKHLGEQNPPTFVPVKAITVNLLMDPIDTEKCTLVKSFKFKSKNAYWEGALASSRENTNFQNTYIPLPRTPYVHRGHRVSHTRIDTRRFGDSSLSILQTQFPFTAAACRRYRLDGGELGVGTFPRGDVCHTLD